MCSERRARLRGGAFSPLGRTGEFLRMKTDDVSPARDRILAAGRKFFANTLYDDVSVQDIASEAGVAHGLPFHYFGSKLGLYLAVYQQDKNEFVKRRKGVTKEGTPDERLRKFVDFHFQHSREWSATTSFIHRGGAPAKVIAEAEKFRMLGVREVISYFSAVPPTKLQLILGRAWLGFLGEIFLASLENKRLMKDSTIDLVVEMFYEIMARGSGLDLISKNRESNSQIAAVAPRPRAA
jgi:AcrR family transcriptional regulator